MGTTTVRISEATRAVLRELAAEAREPIAGVLAKAVETYRRQRLLEQANAAYAALRSDPSAWQEEMTEREGWDATPADGLDRP